MQKYFKIIKERWLVSDDKTFFVCWILLRLKKLLKVSFDDESDGSDIEIDVVIPTISKDYELLSIVLKSLSNINQKINKIFIVSSLNEDITKFCKENNYVFVEETSVLGYGKEAISYKAGGFDRSGWALQQLIKLSAGEFVEADNYFVIDSDTVLLSKHSFLQGDKFVFLESEEWHEPYRESFKNLFGYSPANKMSFVSHMMIFNKAMLSEMKKEIEIKHQTRWDRAFLAAIIKNEVSGISEYEMYANWLLINHPEKFIKKPFYNKSANRMELKYLKNVEEKYQNKYRSISFHSYVEH